MSLRPVVVAVELSCELWRGREKEFREIKQSEKEQSRLVHECSCGVVTYRIELNKSEVMIL